MPEIVFFDTELDPRSGKILDIGAFREPDQPFHNSSLSEFKSFIMGSGIFSGHNIFHHDLKAIKAEIESVCRNPIYIDTLYLAPLLFPKIPYHRLLKDDKLQIDDLNNPLNDALKARQLFYDEVSTFNDLEDMLKEMYFRLLGPSNEFSAFFHFVNYQSSTAASLEESIREKFQGDICSNAPISSLIFEHPVSLAYCLSLIHVRDQYSIIPRWLSKTRPEVESIMVLLRDKLCPSGCAYCNKALDIHEGLRRFFGFESFRTYGGVALQEKAIKAAIDHQSLLAVFPTGGGKSITFQLPALMQGESTKGLTVVISPLQSLMKDQVDNLEKIGIVSATTINGLLDPIDRTKAFELVNDGRAHILYLSPESLRSPSIERLLLGRKIIRLVIDEAHCFSSWGQDFRVDYLYIAEFIRNLQQKRNTDSSIPVSCFTATAKPQVIDDIREYFKSELGLELSLFKTDQARTNLHYNVYEHHDESAKYNSLRNIIESKNSPTIVYVSRTKKADDIANRLTNDGFLARPFHGKLASKIKTENQNAFISGEVPIMVATSAFGMGVDKKNIQSVIHYDISDSLENYVQEAGRAGRDEHLQADCYILYNEEDLNKHFILQNSTKLTIKEINQIWKAIKEMTWYRNTVSNSALEIAREAGWDDTVGEIETRVTTAIAALEEAGYLKRNQNQASVYANSIQSRNAQEAIELINQSMLFTEFEKISGIRMIKYLIGSKRRSLNDEGEAESRVDYIADLLSIPNKEVIHIVDLLRQENILADQMDLTAYIIRGENQSRIAKKVKTFNGILRFFYSHCDDETLEVNLKQVKKELQEHETLEADINQLRISLLYLGMKGMIKFRYWDPAKNNANILFTETSISFVRHLEILEFLAPLITQFLIDKSKLVIDDREEVLVEFSVGEIMAYVEKSNQLFNRACSVSDVEDCLFYLAKIKAINIEGGFMIVYKRIRLERIELKNSIRYKKEDYKKLEQYYESKIQQVHIVGEYASKMISDYVGALNFVEDYFSLNYSLFLNKYFPGSRQDDIKRTITPQKFRQLFGTVSALQLEIIKDLNKKAAVLAGPGSGKTRVLVHKLASIFLMEEIKHEQILMLTFSRAAVTEFRKRLHALIGNATSFIEIKTFHSYCFDLLGRVGDLSMADNVIKEAVTAIKDQIIDKFRITKLVMLIDEAQDINKDEYELIQTLLSQNEDMRVIMVGDDDQNIFEFRGSNSAYLQDFINNQKATTFELVENYRSGRNLVEFINAFAFTIRGRLKKRPILSVTEKEGQVKIIRYAFKHLALPVVEQIRLNPSKGDTCILTRTNIEASQIHRILKRTGVRTRLVQSNEGFSLSNLKEVRFILKLLAQESIPIISNNYWVKIKQTLKSDFQSSKWYPMVARMLSDFELSNPKTKYVSDLESFLSESQMEDFLFDEKDTVFVSTYHKAKGKEFENVHVVVTAIDQTEKSKRTLYVAMTRAKDNLVIHVHGNYFDHFVSDHVTLLQDNANYGQPDELSFQLTHAHILLSYFSSVQEIVKKLTSGDILLPNEDGCTTPEGQFVLRYSKKFIEEEKKFTSGGYIRKSASVNFLVFWEAPDKKEILIVLPEIIYQKH